jgi:hypothetical protein
VSRILKGIAKKTSRNIIDEILLFLERKVGIDIDKVAEPSFE